MNLKKILTSGIVLGMVVLSPTRAWATPHFTLSPTSGNETVNQNFSVIMGVDSDTQKVIGIDMKASFDSSRLEVVSIEKGSIPDDGYQFSYTSGQAIIHNDTGMFEVTLTPINQSALTGPIAKQELLKVTFRPKATGVATFNYVCQGSSVTETNIINDTGTDVVDCATNQSGSYTIAASSSSSPTSTPGSAVTTPTTGAVASALPSTGGVGDTVAMILVGLSSIAAAMYFKFL